MLISVQSSYIFFLLKLNDLLIFSVKFKARQLKDYENAVIAKRLEELDDDEIQALVEDIERDDF